MVAITGCCPGFRPAPRQRASPTATGADDSGEPARSAVGRRFAAYANDAVLPFYVLHETVVVVVAYHVLAWPIGAGSQFLLISLTSLAATLLVYDLAVRRSPATRFLFGLKPDRRTPRGMPASTRTSPRRRRARRRLMRQGVTSSAGGLRWGGPSSRGSTARRR